MPPPLPAHRPTWPLPALAFTAALAGLLAAAPAQAQAPAVQAAQTAQAGPAAAEVEFWRSAERLGTAEAYAAYLAAYPSGHYAALARLAMSRSGPPPAVATPATPATTAAPVPTPAAVPPLRHFSEPSTSGAITFQLGDRFHGPGAVTVGWLGARKQLVLPAGEWVVLAAVDHSATNGGAEFTTLRFGKFRGQQLQSMLLFSFTRRGTSVGRWTDIERCQAADPAVLMHHTTPAAALRSECMRAWSQGGIQFAGQPAGDEALASLQRLGASYAGPALVTVWYFADRPNGYLRVTRADWLHQVYGEDSGQASSWSRAALAASPERSRHAQALMHWAEGYRELAATGFRRKLDELDLKPGLPARPGEELAPLADVPWPARSAAP
jgi:hypothetical protein